MENRGPWPNITVGGAVACNSSAPAPSAPVPCEAAERHVDRSFHDYFSHARKVLKRLVVWNYRSLKNLDLELNGLNAFIGPNSSGKSNILRALNVVLGESYPTARSFETEDFFQRDVNCTIRIEVHFQRPLRCNSQVAGFRLTYDGSQLEYVPIDDAGEPCCYGSGRIMKVSNEMRDEVTMLYLPLDRLAHHQVKNSQWTVYGKILKHLTATLDEGTVAAYRDEAQAAFDKYVQPHVGPAEDSLRKYAAGQTGMELNLRLATFDPGRVLRDLRPRLKSEEGIELDVEEEGAGVQSAVVIAIARTYADLVAQPLIVCIEEPELFLHPHACRHFYRLLKELAAGGIQVCYTTHDRSFVSVEDFESIRLVQRVGGETKVRAPAGAITNFTVVQMAARFDEELNEVFFANKVVLVEGPDDKIACKEALRVLKVELDKENISVVDCGGNTGVLPMAQILAQCGIDTWALLDADPGNKATERILQRVQTALGSARVLVQSPNLEGLFGKSEKFNKQSALLEIPEWLKTNPVPAVYECLYKALGP